MAKKTHTWTGKDRKFISENLHLTDKQLAVVIGVTESAVKGFRHRQKILRPKDQWCFQKGHISVNKGKRMCHETYKKCAGTMFQKGNKPPNYREIGEVFISADSKSGKKYKFIKTKEKRMYSYGRYVWEKHYNVKLKPNEIIKYIDGDSLNCDIGNLRKTTKAGNMADNQNHEKAAKSLRKTWFLVRVYEDSGINHRFKLRSKLYKPKLTT